MDYARFLCERSADGPAEIVQRLDIPRPDSESVIGAMKRLTATYPMLDTQLLLNQASNLLSQYIIQGRAAPEVIDELEQLFREQFERHGDA